jgi:crotonobetainyl-CoA:carnitine CoA-transferase CaiB-like acyl-CoA transferase
MAAASEPERGANPQDGEVRESLPLAGLRVLDLSRLLPGGFCSLMLADLGADVLKIEDTASGDYLRWAPPYYGDDEQASLGTRSALYLALNRNKRSARIDLKSDGGRDAFLRMASGYDVVLESFRPGVLERLGVGYEALRDVNPALVYCAITGYGQSGSQSQRAGHDINYVAQNGLLALTGATGGAPVQASAQIADLGGGAMMAAIGILAALRERERSGEGQFVDVSMTDGSLSWLAFAAARYLAEGEPLRRGEAELNGGILCYLPYEAKDGWVSCGALEGKFWQAFCRGVDREDLIERQFDPPGSKAADAVASIFRSRTRAEWRAFNDEHDCCIEPISELEEALDSELVRERGMVVELDQPEIGTVRQLGMPLKLTRSPELSPAPAPALGEHTAEALRDAGYSQEEIESLLASGAAAGLASEPREAFLG